MYLQKLTLSNFKNYSEAKLSFSDKINCFVGDNGSGKTNILDAIYYLSFCKSYFNSIDTQNILHEADFFAVHGVYHNQKNTDDKISCIQKRGKKKKFSCNKEDYKRLADHIGKIPLVMISPYDRDLINDGSDARRKYIDGVISQFDKVYLNNLIDYNKVLLQRNTLLKSFYERGYFDQTSLEVWNEKLVLLGDQLFKTRIAFLTEFNPLFNEYYQYLSGGNELVEIVYESQMNLMPFADLLNQALEKDRILKYTTVGIHKDDLLFRMDGYPVKKFGSQGQQKSFVIAIKLAQFEYTRRIRSFKPILLLDDIFDKLDDKRVQQIVKLVSENNFGQVFITDTQKKRIADIFARIEIDHKVFEVESGAVKSGGIPLS
ncbi:MAG: DNA replication and repair protein RecF [Bacteroidetes bacterium]|nr:MAG: DNA replication and repair protein RecF [Bacteroidota bacterium]